MRAHDLPEVVADFHIGDRGVGMETDAHLLHTSGLEKCECGAQSILRAGVEVAYDGLEIEL